MSLEIPNSVNTIEQFAFAECNNLQRVIFGNNLKVIQSEAFRGCYKLSEIIFSGKAPTIGNNIFWGAPQTAKIKSIKRSMGFGDQFANIEVLYSIYYPEYFSFEVNLSSDHQIEISFFTQQTKTYSILASRDLIIWESLESGIAGTSNRITKSFPRKSPSLYLKVIENE